MITGDHLLDWAILAVSLANTIMLLWLGGTVLLNAERRTPGVVLAGGGLLLAGALFLAHTAILGRGIHFAPRWLGFWWLLGWLPAFAAPLLWYVEMLWYSGFSTRNGSALRGRHRWWLSATACLALLLIFLPLLDPHPLPTYDEIPRYDLQSVFSLGKLPLYVLLYPLYSLLCFGLSIVALRSPAQPARLMGEIAWRRARPWLIGTPLTLLVVSLLGTGALVWFIGYGRETPLYLTEGDVLLTLARLDLVVGGLLAVATLLMGQAVTQYEIFTGRTLPRRGLARHWRNTVILAAGYGGTLSATLVLQLHPVYGLLLATLLLVIFYALFSWRSYVERERYMKLLRPFVTSQGLYGDMIQLRSADFGPRSAQLAGPHTGRRDPRSLFQVPFEVLCRDVLGAGYGLLLGAGDLSTLVGDPLVYRVDAGARRETHPAVEVPPASELIREAEGCGLEATCIPLDPSEHREARWAVPLWSERGMIGVLLLREKRDGSVYTQEEIELARSGGERLIDTYGSVVLAQRLMDLQRSHLVESRVLDRSTRRVLHDEVLPTLHAALLKLATAGQGAGYQVREGTYEYAGVGDGCRVPGAGISSSDRRHPSPDTRHPSPDTPDGPHPADGDTGTGRSSGRTPDPKPLPDPQASPGADGAVATLLHLQEAPPNVREALVLLREAHSQITGLLRDLPAGKLAGGDTMLAREGLVGALRRLVGEELGQAFDEVTWQVEPEAEERARSIPPVAAEVLFYAAREAIRNAANHGRAGAGAAGAATPLTPLRLNISVGWRDGVEISVVNRHDGVVPGHMPPPSGTYGRTPAGAGQGLALHSTLMAIVGGVISVESTQGEGMKVTLALNESSYSKGSGGAEPV